MSDHVTNFISSKKKLMDAFGFQNAYPLCIMIGYSWDVYENDGMFFLKYYIDKPDATSLVAVKVNGKPAMYRYNGYTMVVAIDCIKTAYIFKDNMRDSE